jgi:hypothetical protein
MDSGKESSRPAAVQLTAKQIKQKIKQLYNDKYK